MEIEGGIGMETEGVMEMETEGVIGMETEGVIGIGIKDAIGTGIKDAIGMEIEDVIGMEIEDAIGIAIKDVDGVGDHGGHDLGLGLGGQHGHPLQTKHKSAHNMHKINVLTPDLINLASIVCTTIACILNFSPFPRSNGQSYVKNLTGGIPPIAPLLINMRG